MVPGAGLAPRLAGNRWLAAVLALAELSGPLPPFVGKVPLVLPALWTLVPGLFALPAVLVCVASLGRGCFLMGAVAVGLGTRRSGFCEPLVPTVGFFRVLGAAFLPGWATFLPWALPGRGKENSKVRPSTRLGGVCRSGGTSSTSAAPSTRLGGVCPSGVIFFIAVRSLRSGRGRVLPGMEYGFWLTFDGFGQCRWVPWGHPQAGSKQEMVVWAVRGGLLGTDAAAPFLGPLPWRSVLLSGFCLVFCGPAVCISSSPRSLPATIFLLRLPEMVRRR